MKISRRAIFPLAGAGLLAGFAGIEFRRPKARAANSKPRVAVAKASYTANLPKTLRDGMESCGLDVKDRKILIQTQLEAFDQRRMVNADSSVLGAAIKAFKAMGAAEIRVGAGPAFERDTWALAEAAGYRDAVPDFDRAFIDLNRDDLSPVEGFLEESIYLPNTALRADLIVSLAKMKTDAESGAALSLQNLANILPGSLYGWPRDAAGDWQIEMARIFNGSFAIVDGIVGMEGRGPVGGSPKEAGVLAMGEDLAAVDATCCRIMGIDPSRVDYLTQAATTVGEIEESRIEQRGERLEAVRRDFCLIEELRDLRL
jgi:uncharacterized protein (DUF362 family)